MLNRKLNTPDYSSDLKEAESNISNEIKDSFLDMLEDGFNIKSEVGYNSIKKILLNIKGIKLCEYSDIISRGIHKGSDSYEFSLTLEKGSDKVYLFPPAEGLFTSSYGYITNGKFVEDFSFTFDSADNNSEYSMINKKLLELQNTVETEPISEDTVETEPVSENSVEIEPVSENAAETEQNKESIYIIRKGDNLWNIVKKYYGLTNNRDISNIINKIVTYNLENNSSKRLSEDINNDGIKGDNIFIGDKLLLPKNIQLRD